jgi:hypothetical protein
MNYFWQDFQEASLIVFLPAAQWLLAFGLAASILLMLSVLVSRILRRVMR